MKAQTLGRVLGVGLRVAGRIAGQHLAGSPSAPEQMAERSRAAGQTAGRTSRGVARGIGGFLAPFRRVGGILWLEVMSVMFLLPALIGLQYLWRSRASWLSGPDHRTFLSSVIVAAVFLYLSISSFWRAQRR